MISGKKSHNSHRLAMFPNGSGFLSALSMLTLSALVLLSACKKEEAVRSQEPLPTATVTAAQVTKRIAGDQLEVVGTVQAVDQADISAKISGNIITLPVDLGSRVSRGALLVELIAGEISAQVQQAKAHLEQARRNLAREESLLKKNAATPETVKSLRDAERIANAAYNEALTMLEYTRITAPFSGTITRKLANVGDLATPGRVLLSMESENRHQVLTDIPEAMMLQINPGDRLTVKVPSVGIITEGVVSEVSPTADPASRTVPIKLKLEADQRLRSGQFARIALATEKAQSLCVPLSAVVPFGQMERVFVVENGKALLRIVRTGSRSTEKIEILSGLQEGEQVIVTGNATLLDGQPVQLN